jgi:hypothetical protein
LNYAIFLQPSEDQKVTFDEKIPAKTVKIVFTPTTDGTVTVDSVEVDYCAEEGKFTKERSKQLLCKIYRHLIKISTNDYELLTLIINS